MNHIHQLYKSETGFKPTEFEVQGEFRNKGTTILFQTGDIPPNCFSDKMKYVAWIKFHDENYLTWLENKVTELLKEK